MTEQVDTYAAKEIASVRAELATDRITDAAFEIRVEARAARHRNWKACRRTHVDSARPIHEEKGRNPEPLDSRSDRVEMSAIATTIALDLFEEAVSRKHIDLLFEREFFEEFENSVFLMLRGGAPGDEHCRSSLEEGWHEFDFFELRL
jgi:hypothetical protein